MSVVLHGDRDRQDQLAGHRRDHDPADHHAGRRAAEQLHEAAPQPLHLRPCVSGQRQHDRPGRDLAGVDRRWLIPTVAISGRVNTAAATVFSRIGDTPSPSACHIAIRPCIAATEASMSSPVQSPAAYTPGALVRDTRSTGRKPPRSRLDPDLVQPDPGGVGHRADRHQGVRTLDLAAVGQRDDHALRPSARTAAARASGMICTPRSANTSSSTAAASASSPGSTRSRLDTSVTRQPISV